MLRRTSFRYALSEADIKRLEDYLKTDDDAAGIKEYVVRLLKSIKDKQSSKELISWLS